jgi:hypothetical protein
LLVARVAHGEDQGDRLGDEPARDEGKCLRRSMIEPLRVVYQT